MTPTINSKCFHFFPAGSAAAGRRRLIISRERSNRACLRRPPAGRKEIVSLVAFRGEETGRLFGVRPRKFGFGRSLDRKPREPIYGPDPPPSAARSMAAIRCVFRRNAAGGGRAHPADGPRPMDVGCPPVRRTGRAAQFCCWSPDRKFPAAAITIPNRIVAGGGRSCPASKALARFIHHAKQTNQSMMTET